MCELSHDVLENELVSDELLVPYWMYACAFALVVHLIRAADVPRSTVTPEIVMLPPPELLGVAKLSGSVDKLGYRATFPAASVDEIR